MMTCLRIKSLIQQGAIEDAYHLSIGEQGFLHELKLIKTGQLHKRQAEAMLLVGDLIEKMPMFD